MVTHKLIAKSTPINWKVLQFKAVCLGIPSAGLALILKYVIDINPFDNALIIIFMVMNIFADSLAVSLPNGIKISLNFPIMFCVLLLFGPEAAVWIYIPGCLLNHLKKKMEPFKTLFNISQIAVAIFITAWVMPDSLIPLNLLRDIPWIILAVLVFDLCNIVQVVRLITLIGNTKFFTAFSETWIHELATVRPIYYATGVIMAMCYESQGLIGALMVVAPLVGVFFQLKSQEELKNQTSLANTDALTGLANRHALESWWQQELPNLIENSKNLAVIMLDIDDFKKVNDKFGHNTGDEVLKAVAGVLKDCVRRTDCIFRFGGEEFVVLLPESTTEGAEQVAERIRESINSLLFPHLDKISISVSAGLSFLNDRIIEEEPDIPDELIRRADKAMYVAKQNGKNQVQTYM